jgi:hypothetical protein
MSNQLTKMARELLSIEEDFPFRLDYHDRQHATVDDFELYTFEQTWGSTALGFGGMGGQAITSARTYVFVPINCNQQCIVYFAGRFAYKVDYSPEFMIDVANCNMKPVYKIDKYVKNQF